MNTPDKFVDEPKHALDLAFQKRLRRKVNALQNAKIVDGKGNVIGEVKYADGNVIYQIGDLGAGSSETWYAITERSQNDYFTAQELTNVRDDGAGNIIADLSGTDVNIAKQKNFRRSIITETFRGVTFSYSIPDGGDVDNDRDSNDGSTPVQHEFCYPVYQTVDEGGFTGAPVPCNALCVILATKPTNGTGVFVESKQLDWQEIESTRDWVAEE